MDRDNPIGVFDSGVGGISVLRELVKLMPNENFIFFGDSANAPYGTKKKEDVVKLSYKNVEFLLEKQAKGIVIACNSATSSAAGELRKTYKDIPIVGIEPALKPAVVKYPGGHIAVMATPMTIQQNKFKNMLSRYQDKADIVSVACPGLMEYVERGELESESLDKYLREIMFCENDTPFDAVVLGCTHYPFVVNAIRKVIGTKPHIFDGGQGTAAQIKRRLKEAMLNTQRTEKGTVTFYNSAEDEAEKIKLMQILLNIEICEN